MVNELPNHIEEYFKDRNHKSDFIDLFQSDFNEKESSDNNISLRTDLSDPEIILLNVVILNSDFLIKKGITSNIYSRFANQYMRLKVSKDRKSRQEFVDINKKDRFENNLQRFNNFQNLTKVKE